MMANSTDSNGRIGHRVRQTSEVRQLSSRRETAAEQMKPSAPDDGPSEVFVLRAVDRVGRSTFGSEWRPDDITDFRPKAIKSFEGRTTSRDAEEVAEILRSLAPERVPETDCSKAGWALDVDWVFEPELWQIAVDARATEVSVLDRQLDFLKRARGHLLTDLRSGAIDAYVRKATGGPFIRLEPSSWNYERYSGRFEYGRMDPSSPFAEQVSKSASHFIFVARAQLETRYPVHMESCGAAPQLSDLWPHLSPLMQAAVRAAAEIRRAGTQPSPEALKRRLMELALEQGTEVSPNLAGRMVTIVRSEAARKGLREKI